MREIVTNAGEESGVFSAAAAKCLAQRCRLQALSSCRRIHDVHMVLLGVQGSPLQQLVPPLLVLKRGKVVLGLLDRVDIQLDQLIAQDLVVISQALRGPMDQIFDALWIRNGCAQYPATRNLVGFDAFGIRKVYSPRHA